MARVLHCLPKAMLARTALQRPGLVLPRDNDRVTGRARSTLPSSHACIDRSDALPCSLSFLVHTELRSEPSRDSSLAAHDSHNAILHSTFTPLMRSKCEPDAQLTILAFVIWRPKSLRTPAPAVQPQLLLQLDCPVDDQRPNLVLMPLRDSVAP